MPRYKDGLGFQGLLSLVEPTWKTRVVTESWECEDEATARRTQEWVSTEKQAHQGTVDGGWQWRGRAVCACPVSRHSMWRKETRWHPWRLRLERGDFKCQENFLWMHSQFNKKSEEGRTGKWRACLPSQGVWFWSGGEPLEGFNKAGEWHSIFLF